MDSKVKNRISLVESYQKLISHVTADHIFYMQICLSVIIGFIVLFVLSRRIKQSVSGRSILVVGGCEAGKTALVYTLMQNTTPVTVTSFKENVSFLNLGKKVVRLVDVPGHERVRSSAFDRHKADARAVIFMLDSSTLHSCVQDVAEQLFSVLSDSIVQGSRCPIAVLCNKQDLELSKSAAVVERALQREIDMLRETVSSRLASVGNDDSVRRAMVGRPGQPFAFSQLPVPVTFMETSVLGDASNLMELKRWLQEVA